MGQETLTAITLGAVMLGAIVNIVGLISRHDTQVISDARKDAKLDAILEKMECIAPLEKAVGKLDERVTKTEWEQSGLKRVVEELCAEHKENMKPLNLKCGGISNVG